MRIFLFMSKIENKAKEKQVLLVLDVDETLVFAHPTPLEREADFKVFDYFVYQRPYLGEFLSEINDDFHLAIWSSADDTYVQEIVKNIIPESIELVFVWGRSRCTYTRNIQVDEYGYYDDNYHNHYRYVKALKKVRKQGFRLEKTLIVDDTPFKSKNNYGNAIYPKEYKGDLEDDELKYLSKYLKTLKNVNNVRVIEKRGWKSQITIA